MGSQTRRSHRCPRGRRSLDRSCQGGGDGGLPSYGGSKKGSRFEPWLDSPCISGHCYEGVIWDPREGAVRVYVRSFDHSSCSNQSCWEYEVLSHGDSNAVPVGYTWTDPITALDLGALQNFILACFVYGRQKGLGQMKLKTYCQTSP